MTTAFRGTWWAVRNAAGDAACSYTTTSSDVRLGTGVRHITGALDLVSRLGGMPYRWNEHVAAGSRSPADARTRVVPAWR